ncbi:CPBP family intramembrane glutamic endopeptidase [Pedobacter sp. KR3-3]|uniref:CPBP family intramembrane glutamic endopeptidase n=1 Tax=Pedobacter albus TaxID=3113905 RepID=A0ABU7ICU7_9SPHI|nr:CPBP family intramembrane glutamic endopeptidase [Pedobacter sp. KR3-3]MEE1947318.1 CPBP family intramembrane glutamic endopeptidase [Pedobacter sp. KR3-3]
MDFIKETAGEKHPFVQLVFLGLLVGLGFIACILVSVLVIYLSYGTESMMAIFSGQLDLKGGAGATKILLTVQQLFFFLAPALLLGVTEGKNPNRFYGTAGPRINWLSLVFLIMLVAVPFMGWTTELNQKMHLPIALKKVEEWMRYLESQGEETTKAILKMSTVGGLLVNITVVALIPAICEEFIFRGALQRCFLRWMKNPHVAIWVSAAIFSTIHFQFFGFFPRMFLGAMFGYIYFWTKNIWYTVFAHFLNNAYAVCVAFYMQKHNLPIDKDDTAGLPWYVALISLALTVALFGSLKQQTKPKESIAGIEPHPNP